MCLVNKSGCETEVRTAMTVNYFLSMGGLVNERIVTASIDGDNGGVHAHDDNAKAIAEW